MKYDKKHFDEIYGKGCVDIGIKAFELGDDKEICPHCNGYGSSLKDPEGVDTCTKCGGNGLVKKELECE